MKLTGRFWLECEGVKVFGMGPCTLLEAVDRAGTLSQAADELGMSYSKAWSIIKRAESKLGFLLLERQIGGSDGGGSSLTEQGRRLTKSYRDLSLDAEELLPKLYQKHFDYI